MHSRLPASALYLCLIASAAATPSGPGELFETRIRPVLAKNCFACHTQSHMGGLQLDSREHLLKGGNSGPAIVPGHPEQSLLIQAIAHTHERLKMPPQGKLTDEEIADLTAWIKAGAIWPESGAIAKPGSTAEYVITSEQRAFWSFRPVGKPVAPNVRDEKWPRNAIDRFILSRLEGKGLKPVRPADKHVLIRRATFDVTGLPPAPEEVDAFVKDRSPNAFAKVVDRLLASPHYGERWGRYWLDVARYSDDKLDSTGETPYPNSFRYRDWVIQAFNDDMPYDQFVKAQIAGDLLKADDPAKYQPGLGFYALSPEFQDDRVDATTRGFLGLTVACAQCHDHKYDPIPTKDFYSLQGVFTNTEYHEIPLAPKEVVEAYQKQKKLIDKQETRIKEFLQAQTTQLSEILAAQTAQYLLASRGLAPEDKLDRETLRHWTDYLKSPQKEHPYLKAWLELAARKGSAEEFQKAAQDFQSLVLSINEEKKSIDDKNHIKLGIDPSRQTLSQANLLSLDRDKYVLWRDMFEAKGVLHYGEGKIDRFLQGEWKNHLESMRAELASLKKSLPPQYPFLHAIQDKKNPADIRVHIRGDQNNLGDPAPRRFLAILCNGEQKPFKTGSGRLELAEAIASPGNPLTARVMVNRIWQHHFGQGIVQTPSNFGQLGDRPSHPELLDYLAHRFIENKWSIKSLHREIMLSATYALSAENSANNYAQDPDNRLFWRANRRRLDAEALRDSMLFVSGNLDLSPGGLAMRLSDGERPDVKPYEIKTIQDNPAANRRRTVYGYMSRKKLDGMLSLFDFPNPNSTSEQRMVTNVPLQRLFFMNSGFVALQAEKFAGRLSGEGASKVKQAYKILFGRTATPEEVALALDFLRQGSWPQYARVLLSSNEFTFID